MCRSNCKGICKLCPQDKRDTENLLPKTINTMNDQFMHENKTWERSLTFFDQENAFLKNRLSVVIDGKDDKEFLVLAEYFQNQFVLKDEFISDLKKDVNEQERNIEKDINDIGLANKIIKRQEKLRNEISFFEKDFTSLKNEFNRSIT